MIFTCNVSLRIHFESQIWRSHTGQRPTTYIPTIYPSVKKIKERWSENTFSFRKISCTEVTTALKQLNPRKATGHDLVPPSVLRTAAEEVANPLTTIYNRAIEQGVWPDSWKRGEWTPVFKKEDPLQKENYRPVTVLATVDKILEKLLCKQLTEMYEKTFDTFMSAYRSTYSCETTLVRLVEDWKLALDKNQVVGVLSTDMTKAFDSVYPPLLLSKLQAYGLDESSASPLESYFKDRKNRVRLGNVTSDWRTVNRGCPQGSLLGPVLWNMYQNDLFYEEIDSRLSAYADDHQLYFSNKNPENVTKALQNDGKIAAGWYKDNYLEGNPSKLTFLETITAICTRTSRRVGILMRLRKLIPIQAKLQIYKSAILPYFNPSVHSWAQKVYSPNLSKSNCMSDVARICSIITFHLNKLWKVKFPYCVMSYFLWGCRRILTLITLRSQRVNYCSLTWHFCKASDKDKLEHINERGELRAVFGDWSSSYGEMLKRARLTTLYNRRLQDIAIFMFKIKHGQLPRNVLDLFNSTPSHKYNLRNSDFTIPSFKTVKYGKHSLRYFGPYLWSKLTVRQRGLFPPSKPLKPL